MLNSLKASLNVTLGFVPLIFLWSISNKMGLILGLISILIVFTKNIINKNIGIMSCVLLVYFVISNILYFYFKIDFVFQNRNLISYIILSLLGFVSVILGKPYTMYEAKSGYKEGFGDSPLFIEVNILITKIWAVIYLINFFLELTGDNINTVIIANILIALGMVASVMIPAAFPEV